MLKGEVLWNDDDNTFVVVVPGTEEAVDVTLSVLTLMADAWKNGATAVVLTMDYDNPYAEELDAKRAEGVEFPHDYVRDI